MYVCPGQTRASLQFLVKSRVLFMPAIVRGTTTSNATGENNGALVKPSRKSHSHMRRHTLTSRCADRQVAA